jgi:hypothetical protein
MNDNLIKCPHCDSHLCFEQTNEYYTHWLCFGCGYTTNSHMIEDSEFAKAQIETTAELVKDLMFIDGDKKIWSPAVFNISEKGMLFPNGSNKDTWYWSVAPFIKEKKKGRKKTDPEYKVDTQNIKHFNKDLFSVAIHHLKSL